MQVHIAVVLCLVSGCAISHMNDNLKEVTQNMGGLRNQMGQVVSKIDTTNQNMGKTTEALHKQVLLTALDDMLKPENTVSLMPPTGMIPGGQAFALEAYPDEVLGLGYLWLLEIEQAPVSDHQKLTKLMALGIIAGMVPDETVTAMIDTQVSQKGRYEQTVYKLLMLRSDFIKGILIEGGLLHDGITNEGQLQEAIVQMKKLETLVSLGFVQEIGIHATSMQDPANNMDEKLDTDAMPALWQQLYENIHLATVNQQAAALMQFVKSKAGK